MNKGKFSAFVFVTFFMLMAILQTSLGYAQSVSSNFPGSFADLSEKLLPAVVNISTSKTVSSQAMPFHGFPQGGPFDHFFEEFFKHGTPNGNQQNKRTSLGSGFIIASNGLVVTNNHVIDDADEIKVILHDDQVFTAKILGRDEKTDLALLKINSDFPLPYVEWGNSDKIRVGDWVLAIGNPFGLGGTVTAGIVSARARVLGSGPYDDFLQTDASINRGNSGGPMFNLKGEVVGINTAIVSPSGGSVGIGFAIPSMLAQSVIEQLHKFGETRRGWLGVHIQDVTEEIAQSLGLPDSSGALVATVHDGGPAQEAKILPGDIILSFNEQKIDEMRQLPRVVAETEIGKTVPIIVWRDGKKVTLNVVVGELHEEGTLQEVASDNGHVYVKSLGLTFENLIDSMRDKLSIGKEQPGIIIQKVDDQSVAENKGLRAGDIILEVYQTPVKSVKDAIGLIEKHKESGKKFVLFLIKRANSVRFVALKFMD